MVIKHNIVVAENFRSVDRSCEGLILMRQVPMTCLAETFITVIFKNIYLALFFKKKLICVYVAVHISFFLFAFLPMDL